MSATHVPIAYPSIEDGLHSGQHFAKALLGMEDVPRNQLVAHGWVGVGAALGQVFPVDDDVLTKMAAALTPEQKALCEEVAGMQAGTKAIDPTKLREWAKLILTLLLQFMA